MGLSDPIKGAIAPVLAWKKSRDLQAVADRKTDEIRKHDYDSARRSLLGEFASEPLSAVQPCAANAKAASRKERLELVGRAVVACPEHAEAAARLRQDMDEVENMRCAKHVYLKGDEGLGDAPPGFKLPSKDDMARLGLNETDLEGEGTPGFKAAIYMKDPAVWGENPKPEAVLAFRGSTPDKRDWDNNFAQDANREAPYYKQAVKLGHKLAETGSDVQIAGHSLGGGLASAAQGASGLPCSTYNAAGLHPATVERYLKDVAGPDSDVAAADSGKVNAIRVKGEVLTKVQESGITGMLGNDSAGRRRDLDPPLTPEHFEQLKADGKVDAEEGYADHLHGMDVVIAAMEQQKTSDQAALRSCVGRSA